MNHDDTATALIRLTETPGARLRSTDPAQWSEAEHCVVATLALIALLDDVGLEDDELTIAERLAAVSAEECSQFDAALQLLNVPRWHYLLRLAWRAVFEGIETQPGDRRVLQIVERYERHARALTRLLFWGGDLSDVLQQRLGHYLDANRAAVPGWPHRSNRDTPRTPEILPGATRTFKRDGTGDGDKALFIFRQADADALLDDWLRKKPAAECFRGGMRKRIASLGDARQGGNDWFHGMPKNMVLGQLKPGREPRLDGLRSLDDLKLDDALAELAEDFIWVILPWPNTMQESPLAWLSTDANLTDAFDSLLRRHAQSLLLISRYRRFDSLQALAGGVQFGEYADYGEAALVAAQDEPWLPWLVVEIGAHNRHGWRRWSRRLEVGAIGAARPWDNVLAVYRATDRDAYLQLWRGLDRNEGIVRATVCGRDDPTRILHSFNAERFASDFHGVQYLSQCHGWVYQHVFGGGCDEHHAMFHAQDPAITQRVVAFAAGKPGWYLSGRW